MKNELFDEITIALIRKGFTVKSLTARCFDLLARKESKIMLIKILEDANSISEEYCNAMKTIGNYSGAAPVIIAKKAGRNLEDGVVYSRNGISTLNSSTFQKILNLNYPLIQSTKAGLTVSIVGSKLRAKREEQGQSVGDLSRILGVSKSMINKYESGNSDVSVNRAGMLLKIYGEDIFKKLDIFTQKFKFDNPKKSQLASKYTDLGFQASDTKKAPFDIIAAKDKNIILTEIGDKKNPMLEPIQKLIDANSLIIFHKKKPKKVPALSKKEFLEYQKSEDLVKFVKEFE